MAVRRIVAQRHRVAASLLLEGESAYRALRQAGYSHYSSRCFGLVLRHSWPLRQAILEATEERKHYWRPRPKRRYDRRPVARAVQSYVAPYLQGPITNSHLHQLHADERQAQRIAEGSPPKLEVPKRLVRCPSCGAATDERKMFLNFSQTMSVCARCAGV
jgi:hypothetical protein